MKKQKHILHEKKRRMLASETFELSTSVGRETLTYMPCVGNDPAGKLVNQMGMIRAFVKKVGDHSHYIHWEINIFGKDCKGKFPIRNMNFDFEAEIHTK